MLEKHTNAPLADVSIGPTTLFPDIIMLRGVLISGVVAFGFPPAAGAHWNCMLFPTKAQISVPAGGEPVNRAQPLLESP